MVKRKIKVWNKIRLYETSAVGLPAYPDAHASAGSFSLIKSLTNASLKDGFVEEGDEISGVNKPKMEEEETMEETSQEATSVEEEEVAVEEEAVVEAPAEEAVEEAPAEAEAEAEESEDEAEKSAAMSKVIAKAIKDGMAELKEDLLSDRGFVERQAPAEKSLGELAMAKGLFVSK